MQLAPLMGSPPDNGEPDQLLTLRMMGMKVDYF